MDRLRTTWLGLSWIAVVAAAASLAAVAALAMTGGLADSARFDIRSVPRREAAAPTSDRVSNERRHRPTVSALPLFQIVAARGDCWLTIRDTASTGRLLYEGLLAQGKSVRLRRRLIWLAAGAASNLDVLIDGQRVENLQGTLETVLPIKSP